jgi:hypothetical protein
VRGRNGPVDHFERRTPGAQAKGRELLGAMGQGSEEIECYVEGLAGRAE